MLTSVNVTLALAAMKAYNFFYADISDFDFSRNDFKLKAGQQNCFCFDDTVIRLLLSVVHEFQAKSTWQQ